MFWQKELESFKGHVRRALNVTSINALHSPLKATACAGFQTTGGIVLTIYCYKNPSYRILPFISSAFAVTGFYNVFAKIRKIYRRSTDTERKQIWLAWNLATGTVSFLTNVIVFSHALRRNDLTWIPSLGLTASSYYFATSSINSLERAFSRKIILKCCQKMFEPALIACATAYLLYFQNHKEKWLFWFPFVITGATGFKTAYFGSCGVEKENKHKSLLLKWIEIAIGSCLLVGSSAVLAVYFSLNDFYFLWTVSMIASSIYGINEIYKSRKLLHHYLGMDSIVFYSIVYIMLGSIVFIPAGMLIICVGHPKETLHWFLFLNGFGYYLIINWMRNLYNHLPNEAFARLYQRILGLILTTYSCFMAAYVGFRMTWRHSLITVPFILFGIANTCNGFRRRNE